MALIARTEALASQLESEFAKHGPQVWLDSDLGLVGGVFPHPACKFDFASERTVGLIQDERFAPSRASTTTMKRRISLLNKAKRVGKIYEIETRGEIYTLGSATQMLIEGLNILEELRPGTLKKLSQHKKQSKRPVAKTRAELYDTKHPDSHSSELRGGWYVATNNKANEAKGVLLLAVEIAGLELEKDFLVTEK